MWIRADFITSVFLRNFTLSVLFVALGNLIFGVSQRRMLFASFRVSISINPSLCAIGFFVFLTLWGCLISGFICRCEKN